MMWLASTASAALRGKSSVSYAAGARWTHPWVGSALMQAAGELPMVRILEPLGQQVRALGVPGDAQWAAVSALLHYIPGVAGLNAASTQSHRGVDRSQFLATVAARWSQLDALAYPFARSVAGQPGAHDDRADFVAGVELIVAGLASARGR